MLSYQNGNQFKEVRECVRVCLKHVWIILIMGTLLKTGEIVPDFGKTLEPFVLELTVTLVISKYTSHGSMQRHLERRVLKFLRGFC